MIDHHLMSQLRTLKLGGFTETLELRLTQAHNDELSHLAFLALVVQDEIERREAKKHALKKKKPWKDSTLPSTPGSSGELLRISPPACLWKNGNISSSTDRQGWARPTSLKLSVMKPAGGDTACSLSRR